MVDELGVVVETGLHLIERVPPRWSTLLRLLASSMRQTPENLQEMPESVWRLDSTKVEPEHVQRYAQLCDLPFESSNIPLIFPQLLGFPLLLSYCGSSDCPWPAMGIVHLANEIESYAPIAVGDVLQITLSTGSLIRHPKGQAFTVRLEVERGGELVWQARQTLLRRGVTRPSGADWNESMLLERSGAQTERQVLQRVGEFDAPLGIGRRYAPVSGDFNPIHLSTLAARLFGFERSIAHGLWSLARSVSVLGSVHPGWGIGSQQRLVTVFGSPVRLPSRVTVWASTPTDGGQAFELRDGLGERVHLQARLEPVMTHSEELTP
jgi:acyl dehydratase